MNPRTRMFVTIGLLALLLSACSARPPTWPPSYAELAETATWYVDIDRFQRSAHGTLSCDECHADITPDDETMPHPDTDKLTLEATELYDYEACAECHPEEYAAYQEGLHAEAMVAPDQIELDAPAPTCGHCHSAHYATLETRSQLLASTSERCGTCHPEALETYQDNYHGKTALLGSANTATCADCHGAHTVLALDESGEAIRACSRCHPKATENFVSFRIHAQATLNPDPDDPRATEFRIFFWVTVFFTVLVVAVLAFFYLHTGLWFLRSLHERLRKGGPHD